MRTTWELVAATRSGTEAKPDMPREAWSPATPLVRLTKVQSQSVFVVCGMMADTGSAIADYPVIVITFLVGITVLVLVYISSLLKSSKEDDVKSKNLTSTIAATLHQLHRFI